MNARDNIDRVIAAIEEQTNKALSRVDKGRVDMNDLSEACIALKNIKALLPDLSEAIEEAMDDAREAAVKAEWHGR